MITMSANLNMQFNVDEGTTVESINENGAFEKGVCETLTTVLAGESCAFTKFGEYTCLVTSEIDIHRSCFIVNVDSLKLLHRATGGHGARGVAGGGQGPPGGEHFLRRAVQVAVRGGQRRGDGQRQGPKFGFQSRDEPLSELQLNFLKLDLPDSDFSPRGINTNDSIGFYLVCMGFILAMWVTFDIDHLTAYSFMTPIQTS